MNLALNCLFFQCYNTRILTAKLSPYYFIIQLTLYNRTISRFIAGDNIVYHRVRQEMRLASDNRRIGHSLKHLSWRSRWIILYTRWIIILCMRLVPFLACPPDWAQGRPLLRDERGLPLPGYRTIVPVLRILLSRLSMLPSFQPLSGNSLNSLRAPYCFER